MNQPRWHVDPRTCSHSNDHVCPTCDHDGYYAKTYSGCPWVCRECGDGCGWRVEPDPATGDAMQVQCRTCVEEGR